MPFPLPALWRAALPLLAALPAMAQTPQPPARPAVLPYRSAFDNYQRFQEAPPVPWKEANDTVRKRGGWRAYAAESNDAPTPDASPAAPPSAPAADPHAGHGGHDHHHGHGAPSGTPSREQP